MHHYLPGDPPARSSRCPTHRAPLQAQLPHPVSFTGIFSSRKPGNKSFLPSPFFLLLPASHLCAPFKFPAWKRGKGWGMRGEEYLCTSTMTTDISSTRNTRVRARCSHNDVTTGRAQLPDYCTSSGPIPSVHPRVHWASRQCLLVCEYGGGWTVSIA